MIMKQMFLMAALTIGAGGGAAAQLCHQFGAGGRERGKRCRIHRRQLGRPAKRRRPLRHRLPRHPHQITRTASLEAI